MADDPPFDPDPAPAAPVTKSVSQLMAEVEQEDVVEPATPAPTPPAPMASNKIFPEQRTSAAATPAPPPPDPEVVAKSLFANLTKAAG